MSTTSMFLRCSFLMAVWTAESHGHGYVSCPLPRMYRDTKPYTWTNWVGITQSGFQGGVGNAQSLNSNIPGGTGYNLESTRGHGICGDVMPRNAFTAGSTDYGPTNPRGTYVAGGVLDVRIKVTAWHGGHFEFRICDIPDGEDLQNYESQECLNKHVLKINKDTPEYPAGPNHGTSRFDYNDLVQGVRCPNNNNPHWPVGSCCNKGGNCSDPNNNNDRWVLPNPIEGDYEVHLDIPKDLDCEHCVLQWYYQTGNSIDHYPEAFWNCVDIQILPVGSSSNISTGCNVPGAGAGQFATSPPVPRFVGTAPPSKQVRSTAFPLSPRYFRCGIDAQDAGSSCKGNCASPSDCTKGEFCFPDVDKFICESNGFYPTTAAPLLSTPLPSRVPINRCGTSWAHANTHCTQDCMHPEDCNVGENCFSGVDLSICGRHTGSPITSEPTVVPSFSPSLCDRTKGSCTTMPSPAPTQFPSQSPVEQSADKKIIGYYTNWAQYRNGGYAFFPENIDATLFTHINYAFAVLDSAYNVVPFEWNDEQMYTRFHKHVRDQNPSIKTLIALGGWTFNEKLATKSYFTTMVASPAHRAHFISSSIAFARKHGFDGIDIDWEYPGHVGQGGRPQDKQNFVILLQEMRTAIQSEATRFSKSPLLLTIAVGAGETTVSNGYDVANIHPHVDWIGVMTYDLAGAWDSNTGMHTSMNTNSLTSVPRGMLLWSQAPRDKLVLGLATYGRGWTLQSTTDTSVGAAGKGPSSRGPITREPGFLAMYEIETLKNTGGTSTFDNISKCMYVTKGDQWIGYDDISTIRFKSQYLLQQGFTGAMVWAIDLDDFKAGFPLIRTVRDTLSLPTTKHPATLAATSTDLLSTSVHFSMIPSSSTSSPTPLTQSSSKASDSTTMHPPTTHFPMKHPSPFPTRQPSHMTFLDSSTQSSTTASETSTPSTQSIRQNCFEDQSQFVCTPTPIYASNPGMSLWCSNTCLWHGSWHPSCSRGKSNATSDVCQCVCSNQPPSHVIPEPGTDCFNPLTPSHIKCLPTHVYKDSPGMDAWCDNVCLHNGQWHSACAKHFVDLSDSSFTCQCGCEDITSPFTSVGNLTDDVVSGGNSTSSHPTIVHRDSGMDAAIVASTLLSLLALIGLIVYYIRRKRAVNIRGREVSSSMNEVYDIDHKQQDNFVDMPAEYKHRRNSFC